MHNPESRQSARLRTIGGLMLAVALTACGGGDDDEPVPAPTPTPSPSPSPANPNLASCPNFFPGFTSDTAYLQCMTGSYTGTTVNGAACKLTFGGPGKGFSYETAGVSYSAPDAAFGSSIYGKSPDPVGQLEVIVNYEIVPNVSSVNYELHFSYLFGQLKTKTITVKHGNQGPTSSCRIEL